MPSGRTYHKAVSKEVMGAEREKKEAVPLPTDQELVAETLKDPERYAGLVERYKTPLSRYVMRLGCPTQDDAKDVLQETFLKAYVNLRDFDGRLKFSSWIYRITHNETMNFFRKEKIRPRVAASKEELAFFEEIQDELDLVSEVEKTLEREHVERAISELDMKYREALLLKFWEEKSYEEIADILHIPMGTVATLIARGKQRLKELLIKEPAVETKKWYERFK